MAHVLPIGSPQARVSSSLPSSQGQLYKRGSWYVLLLWIFCVTASSVDFSSCWACECVSLWGRAIGIHGKYYHRCYGHTCKNQATVALSTHPGRSGHPQLSEKEANKLVEEKRRAGQFRPFAVFPKSKTPVNGKCPYGYAIFTLLISCKRKLQRSMIYVFLLLLLLLSSSS
jgi:hypothetical protein